MIDLNVNDSEAKECVSKGNVLSRCQENLPLDEFEYFLESTGEFPYDVVCDPVLKLCPFKPEDPDMNIAFTCIMSHGRFLDAVLELNLHDESSICIKRKCRQCQKVAILSLMSRTRK